MSNVTVVSLAAPARAQDPLPDDSPGYLTNFRREGAKMPSCWAARTERR